MFGVVWDYYNSKLKGKQYKQDTTPKSYKTEIKILANARFEQPGPERYIFVNPVWSSSLLTSICNLFFL